MSSHLHFLPIFFSLTFQHKTFTETFYTLFTVNSIDLGPLEAGYTTNFACMQNLFPGLLRLRKSIRRFNYSASTPTPRIPLFIPASYTVCTAHVLYMCSFVFAVVCSLRQCDWGAENQQPLAERCRDLLLRGEQCCGSRALQDQPESEQT